MQPADRRAAAPLDGGATHGDDAVAYGAASRDPRLAAPVPRSSRHALPARQEPSGTGQSEAAHRGNAGPAVAHAQHARHGRLARFVAAGVVAVALVAPAVARLRATSAPRPAVERGGAQAPDSLGRTRQRTGVAGPGDEAPASVAPDGASAVALTGNSDAAVSGGAPDRPTAEPAPADSSSERTPASVTLHVSAGRRRRSVSPYRERHVVRALPRGAGG
jgi:hypothetical protein